MKIKAIVTDVDGTLTDGKIHVFDTFMSSEKSKIFTHFKSFNTLDGRAITSLLQNHGISVVWITNEQVHYDSAVLYGNKKLGVKVIVTNNKLQTIQALYNNDLSHVVAVGNDVLDIPMLKACEYAYCPADAHPLVKEVPGIIVLKTKGGEGVLAEIEWDLQKLQIT
jgi:3-deoxy-D-manno-octulosonate 8-phosphate phosphatase (KDO 8-P phosphatase)